jgi:hypothetical protein
MIEEDDAAEGNLMDMQRYREVCDKDELDRADLIWIVERLRSADTYQILSEDEVHRLEMGFHANVRDPDGIKLIAWPTPEQEAMSPEELVEFAQSYKPIQL